MKYISTAPPRLYCNTCDETYDLPNKTNVKLYKEIRCPLDDFELLFCSTGHHCNDHLIKNQILIDRFKWEELCDVSLLLQPSTICWNGSRNWL